MPGETYDTLKEKFTRQQTKKAERAGASKQEARNYGRNVGASMAANAAIKGGSINVDRKGKVTQVQPDDFMSTFEDPQNYAHALAIRGEDDPIFKYPSGKDKVDVKGIIKAAENVPSLQNQLAEIYYPKEETVKPSGGDSLGIMKKIDDLMTLPGSKFQIPSFGGMGMDFLQTLGIDKNKIMYKLSTGKKLSQKEKQAVAGLIAAGKINPNVFKDVKYEDKEGKSIAWEPEEVEKLFRDQFYDDETFEDEIEYYLEGKPTGLGGLFGIGEERTKGPGMTLENLKDFIGTGPSDMPGGDYLKMNRPDLYYKYITPSTTGDLEDLAGLDAQKYAQPKLPDGSENPNYDPDMAQTIFDARNELDKQQGGQLGGGGQGGGAGIPSLAAVPGAPPYTGEPITKPSVDPENVYGLPDMYSGFYGSPFNIPNPGASAAVVTPVTLPDGTIVNMPDPYTANQFQQYMASQTPVTTPVTTPTPFNYSQWPQFGPAGGPIPNYVNQGLGSAPQFNYWNQIANTFPGMR